RAQLTLSYAWTNGAARFLRVDRLSNSRSLFTHPSLVTALASHNSLEGEMRGRLFRCVHVLCVVLLISGTAHAQSSGLTRAVDALPKTPVGDRLTDIRAGRVYEGVIDARITEIDG